MNMAKVGKGETGETVGTGVDEPHSAESELLCITLS